MKEQTCPTCTGVKNEYLGKYCDAHNICNTCHIHRSKLGEVIAWGARHGAFLCGTCEKKQRNQRIKERQKAGFDHEDTDEIVCPYCGHEESDSWEASDSDDDRECSDCHHIFSYERIVTCTYSSEKKE